MTAGDGGPAPVPLHPRAASPERRSPRADAFDPPALKLAWVVERAMTRDEFLDDVRARVGDDACFERLMLHDGMHLDRKRWGDHDEPPGTVPAGTSIVAYWFVRDPEPLSLPGDCVIFDEHGLVAIDKPAWWTTQGTRASRFTSLERALRARLSCPKLTPVNRIDRETTGVLLFARDSRAASSAGKQFVQRTVRKEYVAAVRHDDATPASFEVRGGMVRREHPSHARFALEERGAEPAGQWSATRFEVIAAMPERGATLLRAMPLTGRTHQLRVHLASLGIPILGDSLYGDGWNPSAKWPADRMLLHAAALTLRVDGRELTISAELPDEFPRA